MRDFKELDFETLLDLLAEYTAQYTRLMHEQGKREELPFVKKLVIELAAEITARRAATSNSTNLSLSQ